MNRILLVLCMLFSLATLVGCASTAYAEEAPPDSIGSVAPAPSSLPAAGAVSMATSPTTAAVPVTVPNPDADLGGFVSALLSAAKAGQWLALSGLIIIGLVYALRRFGKKLIPWLATDRGGVASALVCSFLVVLATAVITSGKVTAWTLVSAVENAVIAAGGFSILKKLIWPSDTKAGV